MKNVIRLLFLLFPSFIMHAQEGYDLVKIAFTGNQTLPSRILHKQIVMQNPHNFYGLLFWKKPFRFSQDILEKDIKRLETFYRTEGFLSTQISTELIPGKEKIKVFLHITEGRPVFIKNAKFNFIGDSTDHEFEQKIKKKLLAKKNDRFRDQNIRADRITIIGEFVNSGFPRADVQIDLRIDENKDSAEVIFPISPGPLCKFGKIDVFGESRTPALFIKERVLFREGDVFSRKLVEESQRDIYQLYLFEYVNIRVLLDEHPTELPVHVQVKDAPRFTAKFGAGYGKEDRIRIFSELRRIRFLGGTRRLQLYAKHSWLEPWHVNAKIIQPGFLKPEIHLTLNPFYKREREPAYTIDRTGNNIILQNQFSKITEMHLSYAVERNRLYDVLPDPRQMENLTLYNKSAVRLGLTRDSSFPAFSPERGGFTALNFTYAGVGFESDFHFLQVLTEYRKFIGLADQYTLALKLKLGSMTPLKNDKFTPIEERFYAGGSNSIRGWARSRVGPKSDGGDPIGGDSIFEGSTEIRFPIYKYLSGVTFFDFGNVWPKSLTFDVKDLKYAAGLGLRYKTAIGPVRLDVGVPVFEGMKNFQIHISVGQAF
ncbi:BamA/TamA family outer membrane protein [candidate division KSB1 bacterium]|nr:BamA/TamA family outer membrane protein [candidate division KSB1 bacterium]